MQYAPTFVLIAVGFVSFLCLCVAFVQASREGGFMQSMQSTEGGKWSKARRLMLFGASLGVLFFILATLFTVFKLLPWQS